jgi:hypothetical protein
MKNLKWFRFRIRIERVIGKTITIAIATATTMSTFFNVRDLVNEYHFGIFA